jgi:hypothetical protein
LRPPFINFLRHRSSNSAITTFSRLQDIEDALRRQWSGLLQHLLLERRTRAIDRRRIEDLTDQFENLKAAILAAVGSNDEKQIARGVVRYRRLYDFITGLGPIAEATLIGPPLTWPELLAAIDVQKIQPAPEELRREGSLGRTPYELMLQSDGSFYLVSRPFDLESIASEWGQYMALRQESRAVIVEALSEMRGGSSSLMMRRYVRHYPYSVEEFLARRKAREEEQGNAAEHPEEGAA